MTANASETATSVAVKQERATFDTVPNCDREFWFPDAIGNEAKNGYSKIVFKRGRKNKNDYVLFIRKKRVEDYEIFNGLFSVLDGWLENRKKFMFVPVRWNLPSNLASSGRNGGKVVNEETSNMRAGPVASDGFGIERPGSRSIVLAPVPEVIAEVFLKIKRVWDELFWLSEEEFYKTLESEDEKIRWYYYLLWHRLHVEEICYPSLRGRIMANRSNYRAETLGGRDLLGATFFVIKKHYGLFGEKRTNFFETPSTLRKLCNFFLSRHSKEFKKNEFMKFEQICFAIKQAKLLTFDGVDGSLKL